MTEKAKRADIPLDLARLIEARYPIGSFNVKVGLVLHEFFAGKTVASDPEKVQQVALTEEVNPKPEKKALSGLDRFKKTGS